ncbi:lipopolysaccharide heptosyltransferase II [Chlamydiota bacterium]
MNVLQIVPELNVGGVETGTLDLASELIKRGHNAFVISHGGELVKELTHVGACHITMPVHKKNLFTILKLSFFVRKIIREKHIDIVHARSRVPAWIAFFAIKNTSAHFITTCHGYYSRHFGSRIMGKGERVIAVSRIIQDHMIEDFAVPVSRIRIIPRGIDIRKFSSALEQKIHDKKEFHIGIIGRLTPIKGHVYFLQAINEAIKTVPNLRAFVIGDAHEKRRHYREELLELTHSLRIEDYVVFTGVCNNIFSVLPQLDCLCMTSIVPEAFGRVIVEAFAAKIPVISTRIGGAIDIIEDKKTGLLVEPRNVQALVRGIIEIIKNPHKTQIMVEEAFSVLQERYSLEHMVSQTVTVYNEVMKSPKILIAKFSSLGDVVLVSPSIRSIREKYPQALITVVTYPQHKEIFKRCPYVDEIIIYDRVNKHHSLKGFLRLGDELKRRKYDIAIDLQNNFKSHILLFRSRAKIRVGYARGKRDILLTHKIVYKQEQEDPIKSQARLLASIDIPITEDRLEFWTNDQDHAYIKEFLKREHIKEEEALLCINPGSHPRWTTKRWPLDRFVAVANKVFNQHGMRTVFIGGKESIPMSSDLKTRIEHPYIDAIGKTTIPQLGALLKRCSLLLTGDSAPLHIGVALNLPIIAFFGPTDPKRHVPPGKVTVFYKGIECSPCYSPECHRSSLFCMQEIRETEVLKTIALLLKKE